jgi:hypothetical protein
MSKGPTYREENAIDWTKTYRFIRDGIKQCQEAWRTKENVDTRVLNEWKCRLLYEVRAQIKILKKANPTSRGRNTFRETSSFYRHSRKTLDDVTVKTYLNEFHQKYVITPTDKAGNNFSIVCKTFYIACLLKELSISKGDVKKVDSKSTYRCLKTKPSAIVKRHRKYMESHNITLDESEMSLPFLYWIPKMHKSPTKQRYIAASHSCSTKPLSKMITFCLKLIQQTHSNYCKRITKNTGFNRMWIVDNSV